MTELHQLSVGEMAEGLRRRDFTATDLLAHYRARIARIDPQLNAFVHLDANAATAAAGSDARLAAGRALGPLDGIPVAVKDNLLVRDTPAVWGSPLFVGRVADRDEEPVARLRRAGAVIVGKTNTPEFALRGVTDNRVFGATANPWDLTLTPGGSSGGAVAAVAAGLVPLALATDGGGSIRRPAAHTGLVGLKTGLGRIPRHGGLPELMADFETVGPVARTVDGARILFRTLASGSPLPAPSRPPRVLLVERFAAEPADPDILARCREAADVLAGLGCEVTTGPLPFTIDGAMAAWRTAMEIGLAELAAREPAFFDLAAPDYAEQARAGQRLTAADEALAGAVVTHFRAETARVFEAVDVIMTPTVAAQPWPLGDTHPGVIDGQPVGPRGHAVYTGWVNVCGHPAVALPTAPHPDGLPTGFQLVGRMGADESLLDLAAAYEQARPWADRWPKVAAL